MRNRDVRGSWVWLLNIGAWVGINVVSTGSNLAGIDCLLVSHKKLWEAGSLTGVQVEFGGVLIGALARSTGDGDGGTVHIIFRLSSLLRNPCPPECIVTRCYALGNSIIKRRWTLSSRASAHNAHNHLPRRRGSWCLVLGESQLAGATTVHR